MKTHSRVVAVAVMCVVCISTMASGGLPVPGTNQPPTELAMINGPIPGHFFGVDVSSAGDVDGDGFTDLLVGAHSPVGSGLPEAYLFSGPFSTDLHLDDASATFLPWDGNDTGTYWYRTRVASLGDIDGDGFSDIAVRGARGNSSMPGSGLVALFYGPVSGEMKLSEADAVLFGDPSFGDAIVPLGDVDADGAIEFAIGSTWLGRIWVFEGAPQGQVSTSEAIASFAGLGGWQVTFGAEIAVGDFNGDGIADIASGDRTSEPWYPSPADGMIGVFYGPFSGHRNLESADVLIVPGPGASRIMSPAMAGDFDGNGIDDLTFVSEIPGIGFDGPDRTAQVAYGPLAGVVVVDVLPHGRRGGTNGMSLTGAASIPDWSGDGFDELVTVTTGDLYVHEGPILGTTLADQANYWYPPWTSGSHLATAGDLDGDGLTDLAIGRVAWPDHDGRVSVMTRGSGIPTQ